MEDQKKMLLIFDMDNTILKETTDYEVIKLLSKSSLDTVTEPWQNWAKYMQQVYKKMKEESISLDKVRDSVVKIELNEGFFEIFEMIRTNRDKFETLIISGANTLYIKWVLEHYKIEDLFDKCFSNIAEPDEECLIRISPNHVHECPVCLHDLSQCKKKVIEDYLLSKQINPKTVSDHYTRIIYVGDGENDYCPSTLLTSNDLLFPREDYALFKMVCEKVPGENLRKLNCVIHSWKNGTSIVEILKKLLSDNSNK